MKNKIVLSCLLASISTMAGPIELSCKQKAKETAAAIYQDCISENKQAEVERIRSEYKEQLAELKNKYNSQLETLAPKAKVSRDKNKINSNSRSKPLPEKMELQIEEKVKPMARKSLKVEKIDITDNEASEIFRSRSEDTFKTEADIKSELTASPAPEIVEIPIQSE